MNYLNKALENRATLGIQNGYCSNLDENPSVSVVIVRLKGQSESHPNWF